MNPIFQRGNRAQRALTTAEGPQARAGWNASLRLVVSAQGRLGPPPLLSILPERTKLPLGLTSRFPPPAAGVCYVAPEQL